MSNKEIQEIIKELNELKEDGDNDGDIEMNHECADDVLCNLLIDLGYQDVVDAYNKIDKWYA
jgi:hypothetical protein